MLKPHALCHMPFHYEFNVDPEYRVSKPHKFVDQLTMNQYKYTQKHSKTIKKKFNPFQSRSQSPDFCLFHGKKKSVQ